MPRVHYFNKSSRADLERWQRWRIRVFTRELVEQENGCNGWWSGNAFASEHDSCTKQVYYSRDKRTARTWGYVPFYQLGHGWSNWYRSDWRTVPSGTRAKLTKGE